MFRRAVFFITLVLILCIFPLSSLAAERYEIIKLGDEDAYVKELQDKLKELGYFKATSTGYFGTITQQAVIDYQRDKGLVVDGKAGPQTLSLLMGDGYSIPSDRFVADDDVVVGTYYPGDKGEEISKLQQALKDLEYYDYSSITGYYGPITATAIERFQRTNGLTQDGVAQLETTTLLYSGNAKYFCLYPGDRGADVETLQVRLKELGYYTYDTITGYFGTLTTSALKEFQKQNGLTADGKAGKSTRALLYSNNAKANDASQQSAPANEDNATDQASQSSATEKMLAFANEQLGKKYVFSTEGPNTFDCSGFVYYVLKYVGVSTSRYSSSGFSKVENWLAIDRAALQPGDLLFFKSDSSSSISHTGIYIGDNTFINASSSGGCVKISSMSGYYDRNFVLARRVFQ